MYRPLVYTSLDHQHTLLRGKCGREQRLCMYAEAEILLRDTLVIIDQTMAMCLESSGGRARLGGEENRLCVL